MPFPLPPALALVRAFITANPERFRRMVTIAFFLGFTGLVFASGWFLGRMLLKADCEAKAAEARIAALEDMTQTYELLADLSSSHAEDMKRVEKQVAQLDRTVDKTIADILKANPDLARWYREPVNPIARAAMYPDARGMLQPTPAAAGNNPH